MAAQGRALAALAGLVLAGTLLAPVGTAGSALATCTNPDCSSGTPPVAGHAATWLAFFRDPSDPPVIRG
jgi:hypothetical protein